MEYLFGTEKQAREEFEQMKKWLKETVESRGFKGVVIGLSGGFDSSFCAYVAAQKDCLGPKNVLGILMPCESSKDSIEDAELLKKKLGIKSIIDGITGTFNVRTEAVDFERQNRGLPKLTPTERGNIKARIRMLTLYAYSTNHLVLNTSNLSEFMTGNGTKFGDTVGDLSLLLRYTKTGLFRMAKAVGFDKEFPSIFDKVPTADLEPGQTDEGTMGISYLKLDCIIMYCYKGLIFLNDLGEKYEIPTHPIARTEDGRDIILTKEEIEHVQKLYNRSKHKREKIPTF